MNDKHEPIGLSHFYGGMSTDKQLGHEAQFYYGQHLDFRKNPSQITLLPKPTNADGGVVTDLVQDMTQLTDGTRYAIGDAGNVYKITSAGVWSVAFTLGENGGAGIFHRPDVDHIYATGQNKVARISKASGAATKQVNWFANGVSSASTCTASGGGQSYVPQTSLDENNKRSFTTDIEPLYQIGIYILDKGSGDWTLTLHDDANTVLDAITVTNASLVNNSINYFTSSSPVSLQRGNNGGGSALTYHFHVTSTAADGTLQTASASDMSDCDMELWAHALVTTQNGLHPIHQASNLTLIGNGRYVAAYEPLQDNPTTADFTRHRLTLPPGFEVCGFAQKNLMTVIGAEKRSSSGEFQEGMLFFWDGISETYNDYWAVPEGSPESLYSHKNIVYFTAGGSLFRMRGGDEPIKVRTFRNTDSEFSSTADITHVYPHMMTVRRNILLVGYPGTTTNQSLEYGVYSIGSVTNEYPESFGYSYTTSNGNNTENGSRNLKIGMVKSYGDTTYISWRDDEAEPQTFSVDVIDNSSTPASTGTLEFLEFDHERPFAYKHVSVIIATFEALSNATVQIKYKIDNGSWTTGSAVSSGTYTSIEVNEKFRTLQIGLEITCSGSTSPVITGLYAMVDPLKKEKPLGG